MAGSKLRDELRHTLETCLKETREGGMLVEGLEPGVPHGAVALGDYVLVRDGRVLQRCLQLLHPDDASQSAFSAVCGTWTALRPAAYQAPEEMKEALRVSMPKMLCMRQRSGSFGERALTARRPSLRRSYACRNISICLLGPAGT